MGDHPAVHLDEEDLAPDACFEIFEERGLPDPAWADDDVMLCPGEEIEPDPAHLLIPADEVGGLDLAPDDEYLFGHVI